MHYYKYCSKKNYKSPLPQMVAALLWIFANAQQKILLRSFKLSSQLGHSFPQAVCMFGKSESIKVEYYVYQRHSSFPTYEYGRADV